MDPRQQNGQAQADQTDAGGAQQRQEWSKPLKERAGGKKRPWYRRATEILSCIAVLVASASIGLSLWSDQEQSAGEERRHLSDIFTEIGSANAEMAKVMALPLPIEQKEFAGYALTNQVWALVETADRLMTRHGKKVSALEHAAMGAYFGQLGDIQRATNYFEKLPKEKLTPMQQAARYRSLANLIIMKGEEYFDEGHEYYANAIESLAGWNDLFSLRERVNIHVLRARLFIAEYRFDEARKSLDEAWDEVERMPCMEQLAVIVAVIRGYEVQLGGSSTQRPRSRCVFVNSESGLIDLAEFEGVFRLQTGALVNVGSVGDELEIDYGGQVYRLVALRDEVFEFKHTEGFFAVFGRRNSGRYDGILFYQPNGVYSGHRVNSG